jgi:alkylation response protein AidB-like acyl-CoA dehydrogenase
VVQLEVARAEAAWRSARAFIREVVEQASDHDEVTDDDRRNLRLAATNATWASADAVDRMYHAGGGAAIHEASALQRVFRDVHVATQHAMVASATWELAGRLLLGLETDTAQL